MTPKSRKRKKPLGVGTLTLIFTVDSKARTKAVKEWQRKVGEAGGL